MALADVFCAHEVEADPSRQCRTRRSVSSLAQYSTIRLAECGMRQYIRKLGSCSPQLMVPAGSANTIRGEPISDTPKICRRQYCQRAITPEGVYEYETECQQPRQGRAWLSTPRRSRTLMTPSSVRVGLYVGADDLPCEGWPADFKPEVVTRDYTELHASRRLILGAAGGGRERSAARGEDGGAGATGPIRSGDREDTAAPRCAEAAGQLCGATDGRAAADLSASAVEWTAPLPGASSDYVDERTGFGSPRLTGHIP